MLSPEDDPKTVTDPRGFAIGRFRFGRPAFLAPMSGITDLPFRRIAARFGAPYLVTEMVASEAVASGSNEMQLRLAGEGISPHVVQIAGREARWMAEGARLAEAAGADVIDINMGCPAKRVTTGWSGAALMRDLDHAVSLIAATVKATRLPVTLKMRLGWDRATMNAPELARRAEAEGVALVTVHGRTRDQFYEGRADRDAIRAVSEAVSIPVVANGDVTDAADAEDMLARSGADAVMIGRGAQGKPWRPAQLTVALETGRTPADPALATIGDLAVEHHEAMLAHYGPVIAIRAARKHLGWYLDTAEEKGLDVARFRRPILTTEEPAVVHRLVREAFAADRRAAA